MCDLVPHGFRRSVELWALPLPVLCSGASRKGLWLHCTGRGQSFWLHKSSWIPCSCVLELPTSEKLLVRRFSLLELPGLGVSDIS